MYTEQLTQALSIQAQIPSQSLGTGTTTITGSVDMQKFRRAIFLLNVGAFGASGTVDMKLVEDTKRRVRETTGAPRDMRAASRRGCRARSPASRSAR